jgi:hypothetical protein
MPFVVAEDELDEAKVRLPCIAFLSKIVWS